MKLIMGQFLSKEECESFYRNEGFRYNKTEYGVLFSNLSCSEFGEFNEYPDGSCSLLIGKFQ